jgi:hypothetical protein
MDDARTAHSRFGLPVPLLNDSSSSLSEQSEEAQFIRRAKLIIWDEASMASKYAYETVDRFLQMITHINAPFGGKVLLLTGDFRQTLPVVKHGTPAEIISESLTSSYLWSIFRQFSLKTNMRANEADPEFQDWLLKLGEGRLQTIDPNQEQIEIPAQCVVETIDELISFVYGQQAIPFDQGNIRRAILSPKNQQVDQINDRILNLLDGETKTYQSADSLISEDPDVDDGNFPVELINSYTPSGFPPHTLRLKVGAMVLLLRNIDTSNGLCNGSRLAVTRCLENLIEVQVIDGRFAGVTHVLHRYVMVESEYNVAIRIKRVQFPIRLAYALTINKSQGQTLDKIGLYLPTPVFSHGQLYVAFSRTRGFENIKVLIVQQNNEQGRIQNLNGIYTKNIVYHEVLQR